MSCQKLLKYMICCKIIMVLLTVFSGILFLLEMWKMWEMWETWKMWEMWQTWEMWEMWEMWKIWKMSKMWEIWDFGVWECGRKGGRAEIICRGMTSGTGGWQILHIDALNFTRWWCSLHNTAWRITPHGERGSITEFYQMSQASHLLSLPLNSRPLVESCLPSTISKLRIILHVLSIILYSLSFLFTL